MRRIGVSIAAFRLLLCSAADRAPGKLDLKSHSVVTAARVDIEQLSEFFVGFILRRMRVFEENSICIPDALCTAPELRRVGRGFARLDVGE